MARLLLTAHPTVRARDDRAPLPGGLCAAALPLGSILRANKYIQLNRQVSVRGAAQDGLSYVEGLPKRLSAKSVTQKVVCLNAVDPLHDDGHRQDGSSAIFRLINVNGQWPGH